MAHAPHLPKKEIDPHSPKIVLLLVIVVFLSFLASIAGTLATVAWIAPPGQNQVILNAFRPPGSKSDITDIDPLIEQQVRQRTVGIYRIDKQTPQGAFLPDAFVAPGAILNAQGWSVIYDPTYRRGDERQWRAVTHQGSIQVIEKAIHDPLTDLVYIKIQGDSFRGDISFYEWKEDPTDLLHTFNSQAFSALALGKRVNVNGLTNIPIWQPNSALKIVSEEDQAGVLVLSDTGVLIGIVSDDQQLIESWHIDLQVPALYENEAIAYVGVPGAGAIIDAYQKDDRVSYVPAFYMSASPYRATSTTLAVGDIITHIDDEPFDPQKTAQYIFQTTDPLKFDILRAGQEATVVVVQETVKL